jgi:hypothetical protein
MNVTCMKRRNLALYFVCTLTKNSPTNQIKLLDWTASSSPFDLDLNEDGYQEVFNIQRIS